MTKSINFNIGSGVHLLAGFINIDKYYTAKQLRSKKGIFKNAIWEKGAKYIQADVLKLPFPDCYADYVESIDMIEHLPMKDIFEAIKEMHRVLKIGGELCLFTTDFNDLACQWLTQIAGKPFDWNKYHSISEIIYGNQMDEGEFHKTPFTPEYLNALLKKVGFTNYQIVAYPRGTNGPEIARDRDIKEEVRKNLVMRSDMLLVKAIR